jgi:hypothetical protein
VNVSVSGGAVDDGFGLATATTEGGAGLGSGWVEGRLAAEEQPAASAATANASLGSNPNRRVLIVTSDQVSWRESVPVSPATALPEG